jgi:hypothetical protein
MDMLYDVFVAVNTAQGSLTLSATLKLTVGHFFGNNFSKMNVKRSAHVLSGTMVCLSSSQYSTGKFDTVSNSEANGWAFLWQQLMNMKRSAQSGSMVCLIDQVCDYPHLYALPRIPLSTDRKAFFSRIRQLCVHMN